MLIGTLFAKKKTQTHRTESKVADVELGGIHNPVQGDGNNPVLDTGLNDVFATPASREDVIERGEALPGLESIEQENEAEEKKQPSTLKNLLGLDAWLDYVTICVVIMRLYRALYVIMDAFMAAKQDSSSKTYKNFFDVVFAFSVVAMTVDLLIVAFNRWKNTPLDINNRNKLIELAEIIASVIGTAYTDLRPTTDDDASVPINRLWTMISVAFAIGSLQMISGVKGRSWTEGTGHSPIELFSEPSDDPKEAQVSFLEATGYGFLRLTHIAHAVVPFYGTMDTLKIGALAGAEYFINPMHNIPVALSISAASIISSRALMYCFWSTVLPRHTPLISKSDAFSFWLNHLLLGFTSTVLYTTLDVGNIDNKYIFSNMKNTLSSLIPAVLVGLLYAAKSNRQHYASFRHELEIRQQNGGNKPKKVTEKLVQPTPADNSAVRQRLKDEPHREAPPTFLWQHLKPVEARVSAAPVLGNR